MYIVLVAFENLKIVHISFTFCASVLHRLGSRSAYNLTTDPDPGCWFTSENDC